MFITHSHFPVLPSSQVIESCTSQQTNAQKNTPRELFIFQVVYKRDLNALPFQLPLLSQFDGWYVEFIFQTFTNQTFLLPSTSFHFSHPVLI